MRRFAILFAAIGLLASACTADSSSLSSDAGDDFSVAVGEAPEFDGCGSSGEIENYEWVIVDGPNPDDAGKPLRTELVDCSFTLENTMVIEDVGEWTIELTISNSDIEASDRVTVQVTE